MSLHVVRVEAAHTQKMKAKKKQRLSRTISPISHPSTHWKPFKEVFEVWVWSFNFRCGQVTINLSCQGKRSHKNERCSNYITRRATIYRASQLELWIIKGLTAKPKKPVKPLVFGTYYITPTFSVKLNSKRNPTKRRRWITICITFNNHV